MCINEEIWLKLRFRLSITIGLSFKRPIKPVLHSEIKRQGNMILDLVTANFHFRDYVLFMIQVNERDTSSLPGIVA